MKFSEIFRYEFTYQLRRLWFWLFFIVIIVLNFLMARDASLSAALFDDLLVNSPFSIAKTTVFGTLLWLVMAAIIAGEAAARDIDTRMHPLLYTSSVNKYQYLGGRFLAALTVNALLLLGVQIGIILGIYSPGVDPVLIGPFRLTAYLTAFAYLSLPNAFVATAIQFLIALKSGRPMASYMGSILLVFMGFFIASVILFSRELGTHLDPIGIRFIVEDLAHLWTSIEKNTRLLSLEGIILTNRLIWISVGVLFFSYTFITFKFKHRVTSGFTLRLPQFSFRKTTSTNSDDSRINSLTSEYKPGFGFRTELRKIFAIAWTSFRALVFSGSGFGLLVIVPLLCIPIVIDQMAFGGGVFTPTTIRVIRELTAPLTSELSRWIIIPGVIIYFSGELVWRERDARVNEITDAISGSEWTPLIGKFIAITLTLFLFSSLQLVAGVISQKILNYHQHELSLYLKILFGLQLSEYLLFTILALMIHVVINHKYIGHMVAVIVYIFIVLSPLFGIEHNLLVFGASPEWSYTDMRGFGSSLLPWLWFKLYWFAWALLFGIIARVLWVRGKEADIRQRILMALHRFDKATFSVAMISVILVLVVGGYIFYNTNILNEYLSSSQFKSRQAEYERLYKKYLDIPQPSLTDAQLKIDIYPDDRSVHVQGTYFLKNRSDEKIDSILLSSVSIAEIEEISFNKPTQQIFTDQKFGHRLFALNKPLQPGDSIQLHFKMQIQSKGFKENGIDLSIVENGTHFNHKWFPSIGYQSHRELLLASDRREYGLPDQPLIASLYDTTAILKKDGGVQLEVVISTNAEQIAGSPGALLKTWTEKDRKYFHYKTDGPIGLEWTFFSAKYVMYEEQWYPKGAQAKTLTTEDSLLSPVTIRVYHIPQHTDYLDRMMAGVRASLDYYTSQFGSYPYHHLTIAELPGEGNGLHADASILTHTEGFALWHPKGNVDFPFAVVAHEIAHQWTLPYANVEGAPVMSESIAWYYALKAVEHAKGTLALRRVLDVMHQPHPIAPIQRGEPLLRGLDPYLSYRRGPFALYAISEYVGEDKVNAALRNLLHTHRKPGAPLATTLDLYRELESITPDSLKYLLHDLFEVNTYWELETERATTVQKSSGEWELSLDIKARKVMMDSAGVAHKIPINDWIEVGVFSGKKEEIYLQKHYITKGKQRISITVPGKPTNAGVDPYHLLIDLNMENNTAGVKIDEKKTPD